MTRRPLRWVQGIAALAILFFLVRNLVKLWSRATDQHFSWHFAWGWLLASLVITWVMYAVLIWGWRSVLAGWGERLSMHDAARIWTISNLGTFIPGGVWAIAGMAVLAQERGVSGLAATGSALVMQLLALVVGIALSVTFVGAAMLERSVGHWGLVLAWCLAAATIIAALGLTSERLAQRLARLLRRPGGVRAITWRALAAGLAANVIAWGGYGCALQWLARGTVGQPLPWTIATGAYAAAYVVGYLFFFLPAGLGMREAILATVLNSAGTDLASSLALTAASRLVVTTDQVTAAVPFLTFWRPRDRS